MYVPDSVLLPVMLCLYQCACTNVCSTKHFEWHHLSARLTFQSIICSSNHRSALCTVHDLPFLMQSSRCTDTVFGPQASLLVHSGQSAVLLHFKNKSKPSNLLYASRQERLAAAAHWAYHETMSSRGTRRMQDAGLVWHAAGHPFVYFPCLSGNQEPLD